MIEPQSRRIIGMGFPLLLLFVLFAGLGFALNIVSGFVMFCADPFNYWNNWMFQLKIALILLAGGLSEIGQEEITHYGGGNTPPETSVSPIKLGSDVRLQGRDWRLCGG